MVHTIVIHTLTYFQDIEVLVPGFLARAKSRRGGGEKGNVSTIICGLKNDVTDQKVTLLTREKMTSNLTEISHFDELVVQPPILSA